MASWMSTEEMKNFLSELVDRNEFSIECLEEYNWPSPQAGALPDKLRDNEEVMTYLLNNSAKKREDFAFASDRLKKDKQFIAGLIMGKLSYVNIMAECDVSIRADREFILSLDLPKNAGGPYCGFMLSYLDDRLKDDEEIVYQCCQSDLGSLRYASERLKNDREFVLSVIKCRNSTGSIDYILSGEPILKDSSFIYKVFEETGQIDFEFVSEEIAEDRLLILKALNGKYMPYYYCEDHIMSMFYVASPFSGVYSLHISKKVLNDTEFARMIADKYFASEIGKSHIDRYPHDNITDIYDVMYRIAEEGHLYWYNEYPDCRFDFSEEIEELEKHCK